MKSIKKRPSKLNLILIFAILATIIAIIVLVVHINKINAADSYNIQTELQDKIASIEAENVSSNKKRTVQEWNKKNFDLVNREYLEKVSFKSEKNSYQIKMIKNNGNIFYISYFNVLGKNVKKGSYLAIEYSENGDKIGDALILATDQKQNPEIKTTIYQNGKELVETVSKKDDGQIVSGYVVKNNKKEELSVVQAINANKWLGCMNRCFSRAGVPIYILSAIGAACAVGCAVSAGLGCVACVSAVAGGYGGGALACARGC